jgi:hypothetical protein
MTSNEKWNLICDYFEKNRYSPEQKIQTVWESIFSELLNYSRLENEVERHRNIKIGSTERVITDIIIRTQESDLFIVELKQSSISVNNGMVQQLISYLKQLHNDLGILICDKMYIFDYDYQKNDEEQNKIEIEFIKDDPDGIEFVELFSKYDFNKDAIKKFIQNKNETNINIQIIKKEISIELIHDLLLKHFLGRFDKKLFNEAIKCFDISVSIKNSVYIERTSDRVISINQTKVFNGNDLSKSEAIELCKKSGLNVNGVITFSSENSSSRKFWANPSKKYLSYNWWLILNDISKKQLHVFNIPSNSINENQINLRSDKPDLIDFQIIVENNVFIDSRSKLNLNKWYLKSISITNL